MDHADAITLIVALCAIGNLVLLGIPVGRILQPVGNLIALWIFAFSRWPIESERVSAN